ncbi:hypothetical protein [Nonomuraea maritima]|uniref:hypothetical protein n=1 Tax=Nonomuraea maritima TaxID=683260 RepID=UPI003712AF62
MDLAVVSEQALTSLAELARRAKDSGRRRLDFVLDDLILMLMANGGLHATSTNARVADLRPSDDALSLHTPTRTTRRVSVVPSR